MMDRRKDKLFIFEAEQAGLPPLRDPVANMLDVVKKDEAAYFGARRTQAASSEPLQRAHGAM